MIYFAYNSKCKIKFKAHIFEFQNEINVGYKLYVLIKSITYRDN